MLGVFQLCIRRREGESFEGDQMPPPMCHSSMNKKRTCNEQEQEPLERVSTAYSNENEIPSIIPNSQDSVHISQCNVVTGTRQGKRRKF